MASHVAQLDLSLVEQPYSFTCNSDGKPTIFYVLCYYYALLYHKNLKIFMVAIHFKI